MRIPKKACQREGKKTRKYLPHHSTTIIEDRENTSQDIALQLQSSPSKNFEAPLHRGKKRQDCRMTSQLKELEDLVTRDENFIEELQNLKEIVRGNSNQHSQQH